MSDIKDFDPSNITELTDAIVSDLQDIGSQWWKTNSTLVPGYLRSLSEATLQTTAALAANQLDEKEADQIFRMQQAAFRQTIKFTKYMTFVLSQRVVDAVFSRIGWALLNRTGINFFPELVDN